MDEQTYQSLIALLDYVEPEEHQDFLSTGTDQPHIYEHILRLRTWAQEYREEYQS